MDAMVNIINPIVAEEEFTLMENMVPHALLPMVGIVVRYCGFCSFYSSDDYREGENGNYESVIREAHNKNLYDLFIVRSGENGKYLVEPVEGDSKSLVMDKTAIRLTEDILSFRNRIALEQEPEPGYAPDRGDTLAHFIIARAVEMTAEELDRIPFTLFTHDILAMKNYEQETVALSMAANSIFPAEFITKEVIDIDSYILYYLAKNGILEESSVEEVTKEELIFNDVFMGSIVYGLAENGQLPEKYKYDPDVLVAEGRVFSQIDRVVNVLLAREPDYIKNFPIEKMTPDILDITVRHMVPSVIPANAGITTMVPSVTPTKSEVTTENKICSLKEILIANEKYPSDESMAYLWLVSEEKEKNKVAEQYFINNYPLLFTKEEKITKPQLTDPTKTNPRER